MSKSISRRSFLAGTAGVSAGAVAYVAGAQPPVAASTASGDLPELPPLKPGEDPAPYLQRYPGRIEDVGRKLLTVTSDDDSETWELPPNGFSATWVHERGDRVVVMEDRNGVWEVHPLVTTVNAPPPELFQLGNRYQVAEHQVLLSDPAVERAVRDLRSRSRQVHWLLAENVHSGEMRAFGAIAL